MYNRNGILNLTLNNLLKMKQGQIGANRLPLLLLTPSPAKGQVYQAILKNPLDNSHMRRGQILLAPLLLRLLIPSFSVGKSSHVKNR
jgi:ABC-type transport system involved in cytochrome c biogenesis permease component